MADREIASDAQVAAQRDDARQHRDEDDSAEQPRGERPDVVRTDERLVEDHLVEAEVEDDV